MKYWQKIMKRILFFICTMVLLSSCGASGRAARTAEEAAERAAIIQAIEQADFILDVNHIIPQGFPAKSTTGEYELRLKGDVVTTRLPFIGVSREATYAGVDEISIVFEDEKVDLRRDFSKVSSKGEYTYIFKGGKGRTPWTVTLDIFESGSATIRCTNSDGRVMTYYANLVIPEKK